MTLAEYGKTVKKSIYDGMTPEEITESMVDYEPGSVVAVFIKAPKKKKKNTKK